MSIVASFADIESSIASVLRSQFPQVEILQVHVDEGHDHDDLPYLRVEIVFETKEKRLEPAKVKGLIRHIRTQLAKIEEERFPVLTFMTQQDVEDRTAAA